MGKLIRNGICYGGAAENATNIKYNNDNSKVNATNVQDAIDILQTDLNTKLDKNLGAKETKQVLIVDEKGDIVPEFEVAKDFLGITALERLVKGNPLAPEFFGAIGDGVTNDYEAFVSMANEANATGTSILLSANKTYYVDGDPISIEVDLDCNGSTFIMPPRKGFIFTTPKGEDYTADVSVLAKDKTTDSRLFSKGFNIITPIELGERSGGSGGYFYHEQYMMCDEEGNFINNTLEFDLVEGTYTFENVQPLSTKTLNVGNVILDYSNVTDTYGGFVEVFLPNAHIDRVAIKGHATSNAGSTVIKASYVCNVLIENVNGGNPSATMNSANYVITCGRTSNVTINKCCLSDNWGVLGINYPTNMLISNCVLNRVDNHYGSYGFFTVEHTTIVNRNSSGVPITFGYGSSNIAFDHCNIKHIRNRGISWRDDFPIPLTGQLSFRYCHFEYLGTGDAQVLYWANSDLNESLIESLNLERLKFKFVDCIYKNYSNIGYINVAPIVAEKTSLYMSGLIEGSALYCNVNGGIEEVIIENMHMTDHETSRMLPLHVNKVINSDIQRFRSNDAETPCVVIYGCDIWTTAASATFLNGVIGFCRFRNVDSFNIKGGATGYGNVFG